jgi:ABC-2 type transport system permease protein
MKKVLIIGWKDVVLSFRDMAALVLMLAAPFALTLGLGFVTGLFSGTGQSGPRDIPVILVNQDGNEGGPEATLGDALVELLQSEELSDLVAVTSLDDPTLARQWVDDNKAAAAVLIPAGFTQSIIPAEGSLAAGELVAIDLYTNPTSPTSAGIVKTIVDGFVSAVEVGRVGGEVAVGQLLVHGLVSLQDMAGLGADIGQRTARAAQSSTAIAVDSLTRSGEAIEFNMLGLLAPGMALMFLMFTVANGGRSLLAEQAQGTLPRLLVSPTSTTQVLAGKVFGIYLTGVAQVLILIVASTLVFGLGWGDPVGVLVLVLAAVVGAVGWGMLVTALARTPGQVSAIGSALMLAFGMLGGTFISVESMPTWFRTLSKITPNAWGLDGFTALALGGSLADILRPVVALLAMGAALFAVGVFILNHRGMAEQ